MRSHLTPHVNLARNLGCAFALWAGAVQLYAQQGTVPQPLPVEALPAIAGAESKAPTSTPVPATPVANSQDVEKIIADYMKRKEAEKQAEADVKRMFGMFDNK